MHVVRSGKWKLHGRARGAPRGPANAYGHIDSSFDFRRPDATTVHCTVRATLPTRRPGLLTGDVRKEMMLFDLEVDRFEQNDIADSHPRVAKGLKELLDEYDGDEAP